MNVFLNDFFTVLLVILSVVLMLSMFKAVKGPTVADRIVCVNMMGTIVIVIIAILAVKMCEGYLADICIIYAMISFLSVVVLCKVYMGVYLEKCNKKANAEDTLEVGKEGTENVND